MMSNRHRWFLPYSIVSALLLYVVASLAFPDTLNRLVLTACGAAIAGIATTNYRVLAETNEGLVLLRSSRVRQFAKEFLGRFEPGIDLEMVGSTVITSDWRVDDMQYTVTKRWEAMMRQVAMRQSGRHDDTATN